MLSEAVRIRFSKVGSLQFISHLDLNRTMKTVMIRAGIPIKMKNNNIYNIDIVISDTPFIMGFSLSL